MHRLMHRFLRAENGTTAIEYSLIAAFIAAVIVSAVAGLGQSVFTVLYSKIETAL